MLAYLFSHSASLSAEQQHTQHHPSPPTCPRDESETINDSRRCGKRAKLSARWKPSSVAARQDSRTGQLDTKHCNAADDALNFEKFFKKKKTKQKASRVINCYCCCCLLFAVSVRLQCFGKLILIKSQHAIHRPAATLSLSLSLPFSHFPAHTLALSLHVSLLRKVLVSLYLNTRPMPCAYSRQRQWAKDAQTVSYDLAMPLNDTLIATKSPSLPLQLAVLPRLPRRALAK